MDVASSRIRLYSALDLLRDQLEVTILPQSEWECAVRDIELRDFDLMFVQKEAGSVALELSRRAVESSLPIVYDIDDDIGCWPGMDEAAMCRLATVVTVDSVGRAELIRHQTTAPVVVVPCMIDAADAGREQSPRHGAVRTVASFGNHVSLLHSVPYLDAVTERIDTYVVGPGALTDGLGRHRLLAFDRTTFVCQLRPADVFVLVHGDADARVKDANRLVMAMSMGTPSLVGPSLAYGELLDEIGWSELVCDSPAEVPDRLRSLDDPTRRTVIGAAMFDYAWTEFSPARCAERLLEVFESAMAVE